MNIKCGIIYLKIPKGYSEYVNRRRTDNTMAKKGTKVQTMINKTLHRKLKIKQHSHKPHKKPKRVSSSYSACGVTLVTNQLIGHERGL